MNQPEQILCNLVVLAIAFAIHYAIWGSIFGKAGYVPTTGLILVILMAIPLVNIIVLIWFASATWPVHLAGPPAESTATDDAWELKMMLRKALTFEREQKWQQAIEQFERVVAKAGEGPNAELAREHIAELKLKAGGAEGGEA